MSVNLSKESVRKLPEYTPIHLIDEEETMKPKVPLAGNQTMQTLGKLPECTPLHMADEILSTKVTHRIKSDSSVHTKDTQPSKFSNPFSSSTSLGYSPTRLVYDAVLALTIFLFSNLFSKDIASFAISIFAKVMKEDVTAMTDSVELIASIVSTSGSIIAIFLVVGMIAQLIPCLHHIDRP